MAIFTGDEGYFEVTALSFTPNVIAMGDTTTMNITIKNISGKAVTKCYITMQGRYPTTDTSVSNGSSDTVYLHGQQWFEMATISWAANASKSFTVPYTFSEGYYPVDESNYELDPAKAKIYLAIVTGTTFSGGNNYENFYNLSGSNGEYLTILAKRDTPKVSLDINRHPDDESINVVTSIKMSGAVPAEALISRGYTAKLYCSSAHDPATESDTEVPLNCTIAQMCEGISNSTSVISRTFSNGNDWYFLLVVTNGSETQTVTASIPRSFANLHLAGLSTGGACFGAFSSSAQGVPKLESYYPIYPYGGIVGLGPSPGDVITIPGAMPIADGYISASGKDIHFTINMGAPLMNVSSVILSGTIVIRGIKGYITQATFNDPMDIQSTSFTQEIAIIDKRMGWIRVKISKSSAYGNYTNNTPLSIASGSTNLTLTFS